MCGIAGVLYFDATRTVEPEILRAMGKAIAHRGPDAQGFFNQPGIGMVHRRLSIIDLSGGDQPIGNEDDTIQVIFNGEIYNYQQLRDDLIAKGHSFRTHSDTEVLVHLYEELGEKLVEKLRGMFAFALWDGRTHRLLLARDRLGIKPLYVYRDGKRVVFGSEIKALLAHPAVPRELDVFALEDYLTFGMVPGPRSIFKGIEKLPPAHTLSIERNLRPERPQQYWQLRIEPDENLSVNDWHDAIEAKLEESIKLHLIADVPVGAFLSGGMDSSAIVGKASQYTTSPIQTFSIGFDDAKWSELPYARKLAETFKTDHTEEIVTPDAVSLLEELTQFYDEPFADSSALPTFLVSKLAAEKVKVVLSGDGGDECFGGYARYAHDLKEARMRRWLPGWFRRGVLSRVAKVWPAMDWLPRPLRAKTRLTNLSLEEANAYGNTLSICRLPLRRQILSGDVVHQLQDHEPTRLLEHFHRQAGSPHSLDGMLYADIHTLLPDDFLVKVDRASMANGLEVRPPLLDHEFMELAAKVPAEYKVRKGETKWIFKETIRRFLPSEVLERPKQGFELPLNDWLRGPLRDVFESTVLSSSSIAPLLAQDRVESMYRQHVAGRGRHGGTLWSLLVLAQWAERYLSQVSNPPHLTV